MHTLGTDSRGGRRDGQVNGMEIEFEMMFNDILPGKLGVRVMKPRESKLSSTRFNAQEMSRKVADIEAMIREFEDMVADLTRQIAAEEDRTGVRDASHFAYSTFAKAAAQRRENLAMSIDDLRTKLEIAVQDRDNAIEGLRRLGSTDTRESGRSRRRGETTSAAAG